MPLPQVPKVDLRRRFGHLYRPSARVAELVDVPDLLFLMTEGEVPAGDEPGSSAEFQQAIGALYSIGYTLKFASRLRAQDPIDYPVMPLEGLWSSRSGEFALQAGEPWDYTLMMMQPDHITAGMLEEAVAAAGRKHPSPALATVRLERFQEGRCVQIMHIGPYADEPQTIARLHAHAAHHGYRLQGRHHEIYLGDPRRARPENLKTVLRHPIELQG
jgi:hypothetical protein